MAGLYLHIPFCERKCIYCNFYSVETLESRERFLEALIREIDMRADALAGRPAAPREYSTIFFGGGTPSLLSPAELERIMSRLRDRFAIASDAEFTMECNPGALTTGWLGGYRDLGVNRLSFGVQSFHDDELAFLSRIHTADEARGSIRAAMEVFDNVSLDLIFALPGQTRERWRSNLVEGVELGTGHISAYSLIFEPGTPLNTMRLAGRVAPAPEGLDADMYEETMETLSARGFRQYEVSNHARPGRESRHNLAYWERRSYISFGPSAHSFLRGDADDAAAVPGGGRRWANVSSLAAYLEGMESGRLPVSSAELLTSQAVLEEIVMLGLRSRGIDLAEFRAVAGCDLEQAAPTDIAMLLEKGYAVLDEGRLSLTSKGYPFADHLALKIIDAAEKIAA